MSRFRKERGIIAKAGIELATRFVQSPSLSVLMRDESLPSHERGWLLFDPDKRLKEWLAGTLIVEVTHPDNTSIYLSMKTRARP